MKKSAAKKHKPRRAKPGPPQIFVRITEDRAEQYARASIRVKPGGYCYLLWRDGERVRNLYLGKRKVS